jgi:hypothetical protein
MLPTYRENAALSVVVRTYQRVRRLQIDVIGDQHQAAAFQRQIDAARGIRKYDGSHAQRSQHAHAEGDLRRRVAFVQVDAARHRGDFQRAQLSEDELARMSDGGGARPAWNFGVGISVGSASSSAKAPNRCPAPPHARTQRSARFQEPSGAVDCGVGHSSIPAMQADMKLAMLPAATAFRPSRARSDLRLGASAPMPPICMAMELRLAKPHSA